MGTQNQDPNRDRKQQQAANPQSGNNPQRDQQGGAGQKPGQQSGQNPQRDQQGGQGQKPGQQGGHDRDRT